MLGSLQILNTWHHLSLRDSERTQPLTAERRGNATQPHPGDFLCSLGKGGGTEDRTGERKRRCKRRAGGPQLVWRVCENQAGTFHPKDAAPHASVSGVWAGVQLPPGHLGRAPAAQLCPTAGPSAPRPASGLRILTHSIAASCGVGCRHGLDLALLWLWCSLVATALI